MANPVIHTVPVKEWYKIATDINSGNIQKATKNETNNQIFYQTYRLTGDPAPTEQNEGVRMFADDPVSEDIASIEQIDVYVWAENGPAYLRLNA